MWADIGLWAGLSTAIAAFVTGWVRTRAIRRGILDVPNARSSHTIPTPRGGGLAIAATCLVGLVALAVADQVSGRLLGAFGIGGMLVALVGYLDDTRGMGRRVRLFAHFIAAASLLLFLSREPAADFTIGLLPLWASAVVLALGVMWSINLFNFMDGIDGLAASQALFVTTAAAALAAWTQPWLMLAVVTAAASFGFLLWNWPPARIFMGDVGSGFLGFWLGALAVTMHAHDVLPIWTFVILHSVFIADATATLLCRMYLRQRWRDPHRTHAYQQLAVRWRSHLPVTMLGWLVNLMFVLPLAYVSVLLPAAAPWIAIAVVLAWMIACLKLGAGREISA